MSDLSDEKKSPPRVSVRHAVFLSLAGHWGKLHLLAAEYAGCRLGSETPRYITFCTFGIKNEATEKQMAQDHCETDLVTWDIENTQLTRVLGHSQR